MLNVPLKRNAHVEEPHKLHTYDSILKKKTFAENCDTFTCYEAILCTEAVR